MSATYVRTTYISASRDHLVEGHDSINTHLKCSVPALNATSIPGRGSRTHELSVKFGSGMYTVLSETTAVDMISAPSVASFSASALKRTKIGMESTQISSIVEADILCAAGADELSRLAPTCRLNGRSL